MKFLLGTFALAISIGSATAQVTAVPVSSEPDHHQVLENEYTRVFYVEVPVGKQTLLHEHKNDYVFVTLGDGDIENTPQGKAPVRQQFQDGDVRYVKGPLVHVAKDLASTPFRNVTIEILKPGEPGAEQRTKEQMSEMIANQKVIISKYGEGSSLSSGAKEATLPGLIVAVSELKLITPKDQNLVLHPGEVKWIPAGVEYSAQRLGSKPLQFVVVRYK
jgi:mannose-6-phosphate isomerase-like protein (cupin superfamily)